MKKARFLLFILLAALVAVGCNGGGENGNSDGDAGNGDADAGPECLTDNDCTPPETCQPDNTCAYIPDPNNNKANGQFDLEMDNPGLGGVVLVSGKFDGKYLYLDYGGLVEFNAAQDRTEMQIFGLVTNRLLYALVLYLPRDCPTGQMIRFGTGGVATGTLDEVDLNADGYEIGRRSVGEIIGGYIAFSHYNYNPGSQVAGTLEVQFRVIR